MKIWKNALIIFVLSMVMDGCTATTTEYAAKGAAAGAVSASLVGAMTDLIVDGRVNTYRLSRNMVGGAIAGGIAGGIAGSQQEAAAREKAGARKTEQTSVPATDKSEAEIEALAKQIGPDNLNALKALVQCRHEDAFRTALQTSGSDNTDFREAGLIIQALVDRDRGNTAGVDRILPEVIAMNDELGDMATAQLGLEDIYNVLQDERKVQGLDVTCP